MSRRVLDPSERIAEVLFGLMMFLTVTGSLSIAEARPRRESSRHPCTSTRSWTIATTHPEREIQRGLLVGFSYKSLTTAIHVFNPDDTHPVVVFSASLAF